MAGAAAGSGAEGPGADSGERGPRLAFRVLADADGASGALDEIFRAYWPAYRRWMGRAPEVAIEACVAALRRDMPELVPTFERLRERFGPGDDEVARFLSLYRPPRMVRACSQIVLDADDGPVLLRSYDHHPDLFDGVILSADFWGRETLVLTDCLWGALDGINDDGLAVALAFGGRNAFGDGFAAPLIVRYLLETCATVAEARATLARVPVCMPYTFVVVDAAGEFVTAFLGPDREAGFVTRRASTNHQRAVEWERYIRQTHSTERLAVLEQLLGGETDVDRVRAAFLADPLWRRDYATAAGTLYVAEYRSGPRSLALHWPGRTERFALGSVEPRAFEVELPVGV
jgi:predicted choloylglycine hydrolase